MILTTIIIAILSSKPKGRRGCGN